MTHQFIGIIIIHCGNKTKSHLELCHIHRKNPAGEGEIPWTFKPAQRLSQRQTHPILPPQGFPDPVNLIELLTLPEEVVGMRFETEPILGHNPQTQKHRELRQPHAPLVDLLHSETDFFKRHCPSLEISLGKVSGASHVLCKDERLWVWGVEGDRGLGQTQEPGHGVLFLPTALCRVPTAHY